MTKAFKLTVAVAFASGVMAASAPALGDEQVTPLLNTRLAGMEEMEANIALVEVDPGFVTERHLHPGHVFLYVLEGSIEIDVDGMESVQISAGEAAYELPNTPMVGRNTSSVDGARFVLFQVGPTGAPLTIDQPK